MPTVRNLAYHILRLGLGATFIIIGFFILRSPQGWATFLQPWAAGLVSKVLPVTDVMVAVGTFDIVIGIAFVSNLFMPIAAGLASLHIFTVLIVTGITEVTVRDIGLLAGTIGLLLDTFKGLSRKIQEKT